MVLTSEIQFENNPNAIFYAGQVINGKVTLTADKVKQVKAVVLKITGSAVVRWDETSGSGDKRKRVTYSGKEDYINSVTYLMSPTTSDQSVVIEPGIHTFSFACHLPANCPSSFEGNTGNIRYIVQVNLERPWKFDQKFTKAFTVLNVMNLNYNDPVLALPVSTDVSKIFCCGPFKSDPLQMQVQLPQTGYVPGQLIPISILVTNETSADINEMCARLVMVIDFHAEHPYKRSKQETKIVSKLIGDPVPRYTKKQFNYLLPIPATPASCNALCRIIHIGYRVEVEAKISGFIYANQCTHTPITIGNVPLETGGLVVQQQPMPCNFLKEENAKGVENNVTVKSLVDNNNDPCTSNRNGEPWWATSNIPPPVYMEADHMIKAQLSQESEHDYGEKTFTPKYPVFNIPTPTSPQPPNNTLGSGDEIDGHIMPSAVTDPDKTTWL